MTTLSNTHSEDAVVSEAWKQTTWVIGVLTICAVVAILIFAST